MTRGDKQSIIESIVLRIKVSWPDSNCNRDDELYCIVKLFVNIIPREENFKLKISKTDCRLRNMKISILQHT